MHGIHHSIIEEEANSNWSSGLTVWDWFHGTLKLNVPQDQITIGVPAYRDPAEVGLTDVLAVPFRKQRPSWTLLDDGKPVREISAVPETQLLP
jgi:sterol desaturase/sphingolipid hydroxylase (fatty acid hydroxylase superfamily)